MVVLLSKKDKIAYGSFSYLRKKLPMVHPCALRHICAYIAFCYKDFDIAKDLQINLNNEEATFLLSDGRKIILNNAKESSLSFIVKKEVDNILLNLFVSKVDTTQKIDIQGIVCYGDWKFLISTEPNSQNCFIQVYYQDELVEGSSSKFYATVENDIHLDCIDGLGYLTTIMMRTELLFNNVIALENNKLVRKKERN